MTLQRIINENNDPQRLASIATAMLVMLLGYSVAQLTWSLWPLPAENPPPVLSKPKMPSNELVATLEAVSALHLFGEAAVSPKVLASAPDTRLALVLRGLFFADNPATARAIIADTRGKEEIYRVDGVLPCGAIVKEIHNDHVHLLRAGHYETLRMVKTSLAGGDGASKGQQATLAAGLGELRTHLLRNPQEMWSYAQIAPVMVNGKISGYRVNVKKEQELFNQAGMRSGDIVVAINGIPTGDAGRVGQVFDQLTTSNVLRLDIERGGQRQAVTIDLRR